MSGSTHSAETNHTGRYYMYAFIAFWEIIVLCAAGCEGHHSYRRYSRGVVAPAVVVNDSMTEGDTRLYVVQFRAQDQQTYTVQSHFNTLGHRYYRGQMARVVYLPEDPADGRIDDNAEKYGVAGGCLLMAVFGLLFGGAVYYFFDRPQRLSA
ncbi:DUF3592 domain-containing protein [Hymenobacter edaphi]|uniref:DUF3592 domain-containing protein n=1 Tax=Hymenobacter edaphi TaxID=2211146 RepID=A0A328BD37_9BACT|nr:DUF3592 domain-containing protein [Hymenobacter edaphi]RAK64659.1 hypothetical protein DLM85_18420 [Hymenobacter edaphi]